MLADTRTAGFGPEVKRRILLGTYTLRAGYYDDYYGRAQRARAWLCRDLARTLQAVDALLLPTTPTVAFHRGEKLHEPVAMYRADRFTVPINLAGLPAVNLPVGYAGGLPIGLQLVAPPWHEEVLLTLAAHLEGAVGEEVGRRRPALAGGGASSQ
jgi:aspartyl-tRNA(Asn)/glutamyl-tRNA(Gln) amidotransferase subunit A